MKLDTNELQTLASAVEKYKARPRAMPWRVPEHDGCFDPYKVLVSEFMLQQTQVSRVAIKYEAFLGRFPSLKALSEAPLSEVLAAWSGLGYNRRAKYLHQTAQKLLPLSNEWSLQQLVACPGIGPNTAKAVRVYSYNRPEAFIETNVRTVYIYHFFSEESAVSDDAIEEAIWASLDKEDPRTFYWALMDYGSDLKRTVGNLSKKSRLYKKQSKFAGSNRQIRGKILKLLIDGPLQVSALYAEINDSRTKAIMRELQKEKLIECHEGYCQLSK